MLFGRGNRKFVKSAEKAALVSVQEISGILGVDPKVFGYDAAGDDAVLPGAAREAVPGSAVDIDPRH